MRIHDIYFIDIFILILVLYKSFGFNLFHIIIREQLV